MHNAGGELPRILFDSCGHIPARMQMTSGHRLQAHRPVSTGRLLKKEGGGHRVREHSSDKTAETKIADNRCLTYSRSKRGQGCCILMGVTLSSYKKERVRGG